MQVKVYLSEEEYKQVKEEAVAVGMSLSAYVRKKIGFDGENSFSAEQAMQIALKKFKIGEEFSVPDIFEETWLNIRPGYAGVIGKAFHKLAEQSTQVKFVEMRTVTINGWPREHAYYKRV